MKKRATPHRWSETIQILPHFQRSAHLERDFFVRDWLEGYLVTPLSRSISARIAAGLASPGGTRAWSLTGPYGTGKSAFGLFLAHLLGFRGDDDHKRAVALLREADSNLSQQIFGRQGKLAGHRGLCPVLVTGELRSLEGLLLDGLLDAAQRFWNRPGSKPPLLDEIAKAARRARNGDGVSAREVVDLYEQAAQKIATSSHHGEGLLVILDEAGKLLEHSVRDRSGSDIHVLQELAEAAARSGSAPIVLIATLHQAFEQYASRLSPSKRNEWAKIQGRFEDIPFQESSSEVVRLIAAALGRRPLPEAVGNLVHGETQRVIGLLKVASGAQGELDRLEGLLDSVAPLHPITALILGPLFRSRLAQNERSLFAFLGSAEPNGFRVFLEEADRAGQGGGVPYYRLDRLYDYILSAFGGRLYAQNGHQWALIEAALRRLPPEATELDARITKIVGLLGLLGEQAGLRADEQTLEAALVEQGLRAPEVMQALARLQAASVLVYRKFLTSYQLWEGSDLDISALVRDAHQKVNPQQDLPRQLTRIAPPRAVVARRHLFETGTFRYFEVRYADESLFSSVGSRSDSRADGVIWLLIPSNDDAVRDVRSMLSSPMSWWAAEKTPSLVGLPEEAARIREQAAELLCLEHVRTHTPALQSDPVARRELTGRITEVERLLRTELSAILSSGRGCEWFVDGESVSMQGPRALTSRVSTLCSERYHRAPYIHNELVNRSQLSSAAASAQRELMQAMLEKGELPQLGIEGHPPELSMYRSVLERHKLHRQVDGEWGFFGEVKKGSGSLGPAWDALQKFLSDAEGQRTSLDQVYAHLGAPPYGIKGGVLPIIVLTLLIEKRDEISIYEDGRFVAELSAPFVERMLRAPSKIEVQYFRIKDQRATVFAALKSLLIGKKDREATLVSVVRALVGQASSLPPYSRNTRTLSVEARSLREALLRAKEPSTLLFTDLPEALGLLPILGETVVSREAAERFVRKLREALDEIAAAYPNLLKSIRELIAEALGLPRGASSFRVEAAKRSRLSLTVTHDTGLKAFLSRLGDNNLEEEAWTVSLGTLLSGKPPLTWHDQDIDRARVQLQRHAQSLSCVEALLFSKEGVPDHEGQLLRISVSTLEDGEQAQVISFPVQDRAEIERAARKLLRGLERTPDLAPQAALAAAAMACRMLIEQMDHSTQGAIVETVT